MVDCWSCEDVAVSGGGVDVCLWGRGEGEVFERGVGQGLRGIYGGELGWHGLLISGWFGMAVECVRKEICGG